MSFHSFYLEPSLALVTLQVLKKYSLNEWMIEQQNNS